MKKWIPFIASILIAGGFWAGAYYQKNQSKLIPETSKLEEVFRYIESRHVDKITRDSLVEIAIQGTLENLDPFSGYIPAQWVEQNNEELSGKYSGIGVEFFIKNDTITISRILPGSPALEAGIQVGDHLLRVNEHDIIEEKWGMQNLVREVRGPEGTSLSVTILSNGEVKTMEIVRKNLITSSIDAALMLKPGLGYIRISRFVATTYKDFMEKMEELYENQGMRSLVIDLRQNPGGYLEETSKIMSQLIPQKDVVFLTTQGDALGKREYKSSGMTFFQIEKIVVLVDKNSASASEILAGSLQDLKLGQVVGQNSFGKGLVQEQFELRDGGAIRLSVSRFVFPSGKTLQRNDGKNGMGGITPDYLIKEDFFPAEYRGRDTIYKEDPFILKAIEIVK